MCARVRFVLVRPRSPGNVGGVARAIANHDLGGGLWLVDPPAFDPDLARWMAPNAHAIIDSARIVGSVAEALEGTQFVLGTTARERRFGWPVLGPLDMVRRLHAEEGPVAVVFGPEDTGLSTEDLRLCDALVRLPTGAHASLNLSTAASVIGAWLLGADPADLGAPLPARRRLPVALRARLVADAISLLRETDYLRSHSDEQAQGTLYRLLGGLDAEAAEAGALRSMAKALRARMGAPQPSR